MLKRMMIKAAAKRRIAAAGLTVIFISLFFILAFNAADLVLRGYIGADSEVLDSLRSDPEAAAEYLNEKISGIKNPIAVLCVFFAYNFFAAVLKVGYMGVCLSCARGVKISFSSLFDSFSFFGKALILEILKGIIIGLGFIALFIPGIIFYCALSMCDFIIFDRPELSVFGIIGESFKIMRGRKLEYFFFRLSFIGWIFLDSITVFSRIWTTPYITVSQAIFYDAIFLPKSAGEAI